MIGTVYPTDQATLNRPMPKGGFNPSFKMFEKSRDAVKAAVAIEDYAGELTQLCNKGKTLRGCCPIHGGDNPDAFAVSPEKQKFRCFSCGAYGDVIDLAKAAEDHAQLWTALVSLSMRYNVELPTRPESWHRRQGEKVEFRKALYRRLTERRVRRYYRVFAPRVLGDAVDEKDRMERSEDLWESLWSVLYSSTKARLEDEYGR